MIWPSFATPSSDSQVLLGGLNLDPRLHVGDLRLIHQLAGDGAFGEELLAALDQLLRGIHGLPGGLHFAPAT